MPGAGSITNVPPPRQTICKYIREEGINEQEKKQRENF